MFLRIISLLGRKLGVITIRVLPVEFMPNRREPGRRRASCHTGRRKVESTCYSSGKVFLHWQRGISMMAEVWNKQIRLLPCFDWHPSSLVPVNSCNSRSYLYLWPSVVYWSMLSSTQLRFSLWRILFLSGSVVSPAFLRLFLLKVIPVPARKKPGRMVPGLNSMTSLL